MTRRANFGHEFVELIPRVMQDATVYVSMEYATAAHLCACGCGNKVVTPFSPTDWKLTYDGETLSLSPSIGNWNFPCRSHYFIERGRVRWATQWSEEQVEAGRARDRALKDRFLRGHEGSPVEGEVSGSGTSHAGLKPGLLRRMANWLGL